MTLKSVVDFQSKNVHSVSNFQLRLMMRTKDISPTIKPVERKSLGTEGPANEEKLVDLKSCFA